MILPQTDTILYNYRMMSRLFRIKFCDHYTSNTLTLVVAIEVVVDTCT